MNKIYFQLRRACGCVTHFTYCRCPSYADVVMPRDFNDVTTAHISNFCSALAVDFVNFLVDPKCKVLDDV